MARVKLTEYCAKGLLALDYVGVEIRLESLRGDISKLEAKTRYAIKVDQGVKKRGKNGLIKLNVLKKDAVNAVKELTEKGYSRFIAEPMLPHEQVDEKYLSIERTRTGMKFMYSAQGGVDIEDHPETITEYANVADVPLPQDFIKGIVVTMDKEHMAFAEFNPLIVRGNECIMLDAAVLVDSAGEFEATWTADDIVDARAMQLTEQTVADLNNNSPASFSFRILNPEAPIWLMLSGGGASITIADEAYNHGRADAIGNYGEYSGGPSAEETYLYAKQVLAQMRQSKAKKKAVIIAGGVANFTDVKKTFKGLMQAIDEDVKRHGGEGVCVFVRRGGPREAEGLAMMEKFLKANGIYGSVHGSDVVLTDVVSEALRYCNA